jgi:hypothetical protein
VLNEDKDIQKSEGGIFRILEFITEVIGWLLIVASPFLIGLITGAVIYLREPSTLRLIIGIVIATSGLVIGIIWATNVWKRKGTMSLLSRTMATPELDNLDEESNPKESSKEE